MFFSHSGYFVTLRNVTQRHVFMREQRDNAHSIAA